MSEAHIKGYQRAKGSQSDGLCASGPLSVQLNPPVAAKKARVGSRESALVAQRWKLRLWFIWSIWSDLFCLSAGWCWFGSSGWSGQSGSTKQTRQTEQTRQMNPIEFYENQNGFSWDRADEVLYLRISLRHRENLPILKAITQALSKPAPEFAGTAIAMYLLRRPSGANRYGSCGSLPLWVIWSVSFVWFV